SIWSFGAKPITECADTPGFGPPAESLSLCSRERESNQRESAPDIRPRLRRGSLLPVPLRGHVTKGRPCPFVPRSASCLASPCATPPLGLLTGNWLRVAWKIENLLWLFDPPTNQQATPTAPFRRVSAIVA